MDNIRNWSVSLYAQKNKLSNTLSLDYPNNKPVKLSAVSAKDITLLVKGLDSNLDHHNGFVGVQAETVYHFGENDGSQARGKGSVGNIL